MGEASDLVSVRPPEYWPSPETFALMDAADGFVMADTLQYSRQSFQNRARLRTPQGWQWISIPLKGGQHGRPICEVEIRNRHPWIGKHWRALHFNYRTSPFFEFYEPQLRSIFDSKWETLGELTCRTVEVVAEMLGIERGMRRASSVGDRGSGGGGSRDGDRESAIGGSRVGDRRPRAEGRLDSVPSLLDYFGTDRLLSAEDTAPVDRKFARRLHVLRMEPFEYRQNFDGFEPGMSTLDLLFNYGPETMSMIRRAAVVDEAAISGSGTAA